MSSTDKTGTLRSHKRPKDTITIELPCDVLDAIRTLADQQDCTPEAIVRRYIGQSLRHETSVKAPAYRAAERARSD